LPHVGEGELRGPFASETRSKRHRTPRRCRLRTDTTIGNAHVFHASNYACDCGAMYLDADAGRFGSRLGDENVLVYRRQET
jgi:hypothetical protein